MALGRYVPLESEIDEGEAPPLRNRRLPSNWKSTIRFGIVTLCLIFFVVISPVEPSSDLVLLEV